MSSEELTAQDIVVEVWRQGVRRWLERVQVFLVLIQLLILQPLLRRQFKVLPVLKFTACLFLT